MLRLILSQEERPIGYRRLRGKAVWFSRAFTTKEEAVAKKKYEIEHKRAATIVEKYTKEGKKYYAVYSGN